MVDDHERGGVLKEAMEAAEEMLADPTKEDEDPEDRLANTRNTWEEQTLQKEGIENIANFPEMNVEISEDVWEEDMDDGAPVEMAGIDTDEGVHRMVGLPPAYNYALRGGLC